jgi:hypothetical protein
VASNQAHALFVSPRGNETQGLAKPDSAVQPTHATPASASSLTIRRYYCRVVATGKLSLSNCRTDSLWPPIFTPGHRPGYPRRQAGANRGAVAEWLKATVLKTVVPKGTGGSNPSCSVLRIYTECCSRFRGIFASLA